MNDLESHKHNFSQHLVESLLTKYKKPTSVAFFVNQFNLRAYGANTIAYETGRKWLKGMTIPQLSKMKVLCKWLELDPNIISDGLQAITIVPIKPMVSDNIVMIYSVQDSQHLLECLQAVTLDLDEQSQHFLLLSALTLRDLADKQPLAINYKALMQSFDVKGIVSKQWS